MTAPAAPDEEADRLECYLMDLEAQRFVKMFDTYGPSKVAPFTAKLYGEGAA